MGVIVRCAGLYASIVFALGFLLGTLRVLFLLPVLGDFIAVLVELPVMLAFSYVVARAIVRRFWPLDRGQGIEIGLLSFLFLQVAETALAGFFGPYSYFDNMLVYLGDLTPPKVAGLIGQILFAALPLFHILRFPSHDRS